jgi:hypothetical protein
VDRDLEVLVWLDSLGKHPRASTFRLEKKSLAILLGCIPSHEHADVFRILEEHPIGIRTIRRFWEEGYSVKEIALAATLYESTHEEDDDPLQGWGPMYEQCMQLARTFAEANSCQSVGDAHEVLGPPDLGEELSRPVYDELADEYTEN